MLRRRPEIRWRKRPAEMLELHKLQVQILLSAGRCVKDGGILVYSTCTVTHEENIDVVSEFLKQCRVFQLDSLVGHMPEGLQQMPGMETLTKGYIQFFPHIHGTDGFFIARFKKFG